MGANTITVLPHNVRIDDVAKVAAIAMGAGFEWEPDGRWIRVKGYELVSADRSPEMVNMLFDTAGGKRRATYFFESSDEDGRVFYTSSTVFWSLIGQRLVDVFGGEVIYNDCDDNDGDVPNYTKKRRTRAQNMPRDGEPWLDLQQRMAAVKPITAQEMEAFNKKLVGYPNDDHDYVFDNEGKMVG